MAQQEQSRWRKRFLWTGGIIVTLVVLVVVIRVGYAYQWTGFGQSKSNQNAQGAKTLWDWLSLLIVPTVLALGGYLFTRSETRRTQETADQERTLDRQIADERRQDDTLQAYLDGMSQLLTDKDRPLHRAQPGDRLSTVARARTLTVLGRLDSDRKTSVLQFLFESGLIYKEHTLLGESDLIERRHNIVRLDQANLREANLSEADLSGAILSGADLSEAYLSGAYLSYANLSYAKLRNAKLSGADLSHTYLSHTYLSHTYLSGADLSHANLSKANLSHVDLIGVDLRKANLTDAQVASEQLDQAKSLALEGATMPDGQILKGPTFEDWLKSRSRGEDGENSGPS